MQKRGDCFRCLMLESYRCSNQWIGDKPCPDGMRFEEYTGSKVKQCIGATMEVFQDGYMHCPILNTEGMGCEWCMERLRADKSFFSPDPGQNWERAPRYKDQNINKEETMSTYFTKCGRTFEKSTNAAVTGYEIPDEWASMDDTRKAGRIKDDECRKCPWPVKVTEGYPPTFKRYECRAGSHPPNHENSYNGNANDKCTLRVYSLDNFFCESVIEFARNHPELGASYNQDLSDCRRAVSISCSGNRKGMAAKQELIDKFFPGKEAASDETFEAEAEPICGNCENYDPTGEDLGICELTNKSVSRVRPGCDDFGPDIFDDEEEFSSMDIEDQLDTLLETADKFIEKVENRHRCGSCSIGHWYSNENTYVNVVQDDGIHTVRRPCKVRTHYCIQFEEGQREIAENKGFDPETSPTWCPMGEIKPAAKKPRFNRGGECQEMREDCPCFCAHNDGCAVLLSTGNVLKGLVNQFSKDGVDCDVFRKVAECVSGTQESVDEAPEIVNDMADSVNESVPDVIKPAEVEQEPAFDYSELDEQTASFLQEKAKAISQIKVRTVYDIGLELKLAHDALANHKTGMFSAWCESVGISRFTALNYIQAYKYIVENFNNIEDAAGIQPSLLFAASKPSAPPELQQSVIDGDITKHKDYIKAMEELKESQKNGADWKKAFEDSRTRERARSGEADYYQKSHSSSLKKIDDLEQQIDQLKSNSDPAKLQELGGVIKEKQNAIDELKAKVRELNEQMNAKPIEVPAVEIREVVPEDLEVAWAYSVESAMKIIAGLKSDDIQRIVRIEGRKNPAYLEAGYSKLVDEAYENIGILSRYLRRK